MKKLFFSLFFIIIFAFTAFADYTVDTASVSAVVDRDGNTEVTATYQVTFREEADSLSLPLPDKNAKKISTGSFRSSVKRSDEGTDVVISRAGGFAGTQTFQVTYTVPAAEDTEYDTDPYSIGILSSRWAAPIGSCSFSLVLPGSSTTLESGFKPETEVFSGYYGPLSAAECDLTRTEATVTGTVTDMMAYDSLALNLTLPEGYFYVRQSPLPESHVTILTGIMLLVLCLAVFYWWRTIFQLPEQTSQRLLTPEGLLACQLPQVMSTTGMDVSALILEWANLGYLSLAKSRNGLPVLVRNMDMDSERTDPERQFFARIFAQGDTVFLTPGRYASAAARFRVQTKANLNRMLLDKDGGSLTLVTTLCRLVTGFGCGMMLHALLPQGSGYLILTVIFGIVGFIWAGYLHSFLFRLLTQRYCALTQLWIPVTAVLLLIGGIASGTLADTVIAVCAVALSAVLSSYGPKRSDRGLTALAQARGLKTFYRRGTWQTVRKYHLQDPRFFQLQLPKAMALRCHKSFAKLFQGQKISRPEWLLTAGAEKLTPLSLLKELSPLLRQLREAFR